MDSDCWIGIDGGGTKTAGVALDENGAVLCRAEAASINYYSVGMDRATDAFSALLTALTDGGRRTVRGCAVGSSALDERTRDEACGKFSEWVHAHPLLQDADCIRIESDAKIALLSLAPDGAGALLISGTGVMGLCREKNGEIHTVAGWGERLGDFGSGYAIGLDGICAALDFADGVRCDCRALYEACLRFFDLSAPCEIIPLVYAPEFDKSRIAAFSAEVARLAERGDAASRAVLERAADHLIAYAKALCAKLPAAPFPLGIYGSVLKNNDFIRGRFTEAVSAAYPHADIRIPARKAEDAAALYLIKRSHS